MNLEPATGRILSLDRPEDWPLLKAIVQAPTPLHYWQWGGPALRMFWLLAALLPPALFVTGTMVWRTSYEARRKSPRIGAARRVTAGRLAA